MNNLIKKIESSPFANGGSCTKNNINVGDRYKHVGHNWKVTDVTGDMVTLKCGNEKYEDIILCPSQVVSLKKI